MLKEQNVDDFDEVKENNSVKGTNNFYQLGTQHVDTPDPLLFITELFL